MLHMQLVGLSLVLLLAPGGGPAAAKHAALRIELRAAPRAAPAPVRVVFTVELVGGTDDALRCLVFDWEWGDGTRSSQEGECPAEGAAGPEKAERLFQASHEYRQKSRPEVKVTVRRGDRVLGSNGIHLVVGAPKAKTKVEIKQG
jgi:hypothetical protein